MHVDPGLRPEEQAGQVGDRRDGRAPHLAREAQSREYDRDGGVGGDDDVRFVLLAPDGTEIAGANGLIAAHGPRDGRDTVVTFAIDLWNLGFNAPGDHSLRVLVNGSERKRISLIVERIVEPTGLN